MVLLSLVLEPHNVKIASFSQSVENPCAAIKGMDLLLTTGPADPTGIATVNEMVPESPEPFSSRVPGVGNAVKTEAL